MKILSKNNQVIGTIISSVILSILCGILVLYTITFLSSCSNNDMPTPKPIETEKPITFTTNLKHFMQTYSTTASVTVGSEAVVFVGSDIKNKKRYVSNSVNELEAKAKEDEVFASATSQTLNVFYPSTAIYNIANSIEVSVSNTQAEINNNRDLVYASVDIVRIPNTPFAKTELSFRHLFSILRIKLIQGTTDDNIGDITLKYNASEKAYIKYDGTIESITNKTGSSDFCSEGISLFFF